MKSRVVQVLAMAVAVSSVIATSAQAAPPPAQADAPAPTKVDAPPPAQASGGVAVRCDAESRTTIAEKPGFDPVVIFAWKTNEFADDGYTPERRCKYVSTKLSNVVKWNNNTFQGLRMTYGPVNGQSVICVLPRQERACTGNSTLFTLKRENESRAPQLIGQLLNVGVPGSGFIEESTANSSANSIDLGEWERRAFKATATPAISPTAPQAAPTAPTTQPSRSAW
jgi:hypothetical protein